MAADYYTQESEGKIGSVVTVDEARKAHHLATADPERDGVMTGPEHEAKYGLERAERSAESWRGQGVHPTENRALVGDEPGAENLRGLETATLPDLENTAAPRAKK